MPIFPPFAPIKYRVIYSYIGGNVTTQQTFLIHEAIRFIRALSEFPEYLGNAQMISA